MYLVILWDSCYTSLHPFSLQAPNWTPISRVLLAHVNMLAGGRHQSFSLPPTVPSCASEVLLFVSYRSGGCFPVSTNIIQIYTDINSTQYRKYLTAVCYNQNAWNSNSENMWLPVGTVEAEREVHVLVPYDQNGNRDMKISAIGYRC